ncbi:ATP-binding protein [Brevundimonas sp. R86498]|uniref:ATP-binding protein n=1 Tax=Brevundimonas sp. R86498 TaxID=3093845 RepID=UPI0037C63FC6
MKTDRLLPLFRRGAVDLAFAVAFVLIIVLVSWLWWRTLSTSRDAFDLEANVLAAQGEAASSVLFVRVKDLVAFSEAGAADKVAGKLKVASRSSPLVSDLGYFETGAPASRSFVVGEGAIGVAPASRDQIARHLVENPGTVGVFSAASYPDLFPMAESEDLIFAQTGANAVAGQPVRVYFGRLSLSRLGNELAAAGHNAALVSITSSVNGRSLDWTGDVAPSWTDRLLPESRRQIPVSFTRSYAPVFTFRQTSQQLAPLAAVTAGLLAVFVILALVVLRAQKRRAEQGARLRDAVTRAEQANKAKSTFLANMSHEIRTPLNGVLGMAELLSRTSLNEQQALYTGQIAASGSSLLAILNDILDVSKLEGGMMAIDPVRTDLPHLLQEIGTFYNGQAVQSGNSLMLDVDASVPAFAMVDPTRLRQVVGNLVSNAIKFTENGEVTIVARCEPGAGDCSTLHIAVMDTGLGIGPEDQKRLFERFVQANDSITRTHGGTGLGLSICQELCGMMGGTVTCESEPGKGSTFTATVRISRCEPPVPVSEPHATIGVVGASDTVRRIAGSALERSGFGVMNFASFDALAEALQNGTAPPLAGIVIDEANDVHEAREGWLSVRAALTARRPAWSILLADRQAHRSYPSFDRILVKPFLPAALGDAALELGANSSGTPSPAATPVSRITADPTFAGQQLLLVDDNDVNLIVAQELLQDLGFGVTTARDGRKAIAAAQAGAFDVILMDCRMPVMDGYEATRQLKVMMAAGQLKPAPIIALTANAMKGDRETCLEAGMDEFVAKPIRKRDLLAVLLQLQTQGQLSVAPAAGVSADARAPGVSPVQAATPKASPSTSPVPLTPEPAPTDEISVVADASGHTGPAPAATRKPIPLFEAEMFEETRRTVRAFDTLLDIYRSDTSGYLDDLQRALSMGNIADGVLPAHTIKSGSRMVGATGLAALAEAMETRLRTGRRVEAGELETLRQRMAQAFVATIAEIDRRMSTPVALVS